MKWQCLLYKLLPQGNLDSHCGNERFEKCLKRAILLVFLFVFLFAVLILCPSSMGPATIENQTDLNMSRVVSPCFVNFV
jgi:hypothetical protein